MADPATPQTKLQTQAHAASPRLTQTRLGVSVRRSDEALSPRALRKLLGDLQAVANPTLSDVEAGRLAKPLATWFGQASAGEQLDFLLLLAEQFAPDAEQIGSATASLNQAMGSAEQGVAEVRLRRALASPRARLLQRFAAFDEGMAFLVAARATLLKALPSAPRLLPLDAELEALFTRWFEMGSLQLERISWDSPASLIEKLIEYEAVHDITSWADVKNRLDADRRCYGFFHPRLPRVPLVFVEVAFGRQMADAMAPLLDEHGDATDLQQATHAVFYSISNTQSGLKGVSFGEALIKRVVEALQHEFPQLKHFATLSPMPGFSAWLNKHLAEQWAQTPPKLRQALSELLPAEAAPADEASEPAATELPPPSDSAESAALADVPKGAVATAAAAAASESKTQPKGSAKGSAKGEPKPSAADAELRVPQAVLASLCDAAALAACEPDSLRRQWLMRMAAHYLTGMGKGRPLDAVARFHLGNGARVERLNWAADPSAKGLRQSWGLMVNYCYDLPRLDAHRESLAKGKVPTAKAVQALLGG